jgi:hypothetical protein
MRGFSPEHILKRYVSAATGAQPLGAGNMLGVFKVARAALNWFFIHACIIAVFFLAVKD